MRLQDETFVNGQFVDTTRDVNSSLPLGAFNPALLDTGSSYSSDRGRGRTRRSRRALILGCLLVIVGGAGFFVVDEGGVTLPSVGLRGDAAANESQHIQISSFGTPVKPLEVATEARSIAQLQASLFPVSCGKDPSKAKGYAYVVAASGVAENESVALTVGGAIAECASERVAYLHDKRSALQVRIEAYDKSTGMVWLRVPAPLPGQPMSVKPEPGDRVAGSYINGTASFLPAAPGGAAAGAPVLVADGTMVALYGSTGSPVELSAACGSILVC